MSAAGRGRRFSEEHKGRLALSKLNGNNPNWKGNKVSQRSVHDWIKRRSPKPDKCQDCGKVGWVDLANISQEYKRDVDDYKWICRKCHMTEDGRLNKFINMAKLSGEDRKKVWGGLVD